MYRDLGGYGDGTSMNREADAATGSPPSGPPPPPPPGGWGGSQWGGGPGWSGTGWGGPPGGSPPPGPRQPTGRRRALLIAAAVFGALVIAAASGTVTALFVRGGGTPASAPPTQQARPTPRPVSGPALSAYRQMLAAAGASAGCHYVAVSSTPSLPITQETITGEAGRQDGTQVITLASTFGAEKFTLRLTADGSVYFQGNAPALQDQLGVIPSAAPSLDGRWVLVAKQDGPYRQLEEGITVMSHLNGDTLVPASVATVHAASGTVERISGTGDGGVRAHFDVAPGSKLPQAYAEGSAAAGLTSTETLSDWGTAPSVSAPSGAVAWSTLRTAQPPNGYGSGQNAQSGTPGPPSPTPSGSV